MTGTNPSRSRWLVGGAAAIALGSLAWGISSARRAQTLEAELGVARAELAATVPRADLERAQSEASGLLARVERLEGETEARREAVEASAADAGSAARRAAAVGTESGSANPLQQLLGPFFEMGASAGVEMEYGPLLRTLDLSEGDEARVREILQRDAREQFARAGRRWSTRAPTPEDADDSLREELEDVLTPDELALWEEFEAAKAERAVARSVDIQLASLAPELSDEGRSLTRDVLVEELTSPDPTPSEEPPADVGAMFEQAMARQREAYDRARERLEPELSVEDLEAVDRLIAHEDEKAGSVARWMSELAQSAGASGPPASETPGSGAPEGTFR